MSNDGVDVRMSDGRLFHARGPATANARSPMLEVMLKSVFDGVILFYIPIDYSLSKLLCTVSSYHPVLA